MTSSADPAQLGPIEIKDMPPSPKVHGDMKLPTGGYGDVSITPDMLLEWFLTSFVFTINNQSTDYHVQFSDLNNKTIIRCTPPPSGMLVVIPKLGASIPVGTQFTVRQVGVNPLRVVYPSGILVLPTDQYFRRDGSTGTFVFQGTNTNGIDIWDYIGELPAV